MGKPIAFPSVLAPAYKGFVSGLRTYLNQVHRHVTRSPGSKADVGRQISAVMNDLGIVPTLLPNQFVIQNADTLPGQIKNSAGAQASSGVAFVAAGALTEIRLAATDTIVKSTVKVVMPAITGSYVNGYTFTVANGVITGGVAS